MIAYLLVLALSVPAEAWTEFQYTADNNAVFQSPNWNVAWRADIKKKSNGGISIVGSTVYIDSFDHCVYAFDAITGRENWHRQLPNVLMNAPVVVDGLVIVGTGSAQMLMDSPTLWVAGRPDGDSVYALDARNGNVVWKFDTIGEDMPTGAAVRVNGRWEFIFANGDDHIYALDATTGKLLWKQQALGVDGMASLTSVGGMVYGTSTLGDSGFLSMREVHPQLARYWSRTWAIDPSRQGQYIWSAPYGVADASVTADADTVFTEGFELSSAPRGSPSNWAIVLNTQATFRTVVAALNRSTGDLLWKYTSDEAGPNNTLGSAVFTSDTIVVHGVLYAPLAFSREVVALSRATGKHLWTLHTSYPVKTSPVLKDGFLFFGDSGANLYVVRADNGTLVHKFAFPGPPGKFGFARSAPVIVGNTLFISADRWLYAMRVSDLENGTVSTEAAPPTLGPSGDWCMFDPECHAAGSGVRLIF